MGWKLIKDATGIPVWRCSQYSDLNYAEINNFAEHGQPFSPYESGFDHRYVPDFKNIVIEMPQSEVMFHGFGGDMAIRKFPFVRRFLSETLRLPFGTYSFNELVMRHLRHDRIRHHEPLTIFLFGEGEGYSVGGWCAE